MIRSWVQIKTDDGYKLVAKGSPEHQEFIAHQRSTSHYVMPDIQPYVSPLDGSLVSSRSRHRAHMAKHGVIERGNEPMKAPEPYEPKGVKEDLIRHYDELSRRR